MNTTVSQISGLAVFGGTPALKRRVPLGQQNFPNWDRYEAAMRDIFERQYYTNHGPLAQKLEARLAERLDVSHAILVTNASIALALAAQALGLTGKVVVPAFSFVGTAQSLDWSNARPAYCDVCERTGHVTAELIEPHLMADVTAILAVNLWGGAADVAGLSTLAERREIQLYFDSAHSFASEIGGKPIGSFGRLEVISLHASQMLSTTEGAVLCTNDDDLAAHVRNIRSNYGMGRVVPVGKTGNGRMSEAQAAVGLMNLDDLPDLIARNGRLWDAYRAQLEGIAGLTLIEPAGVSSSNRQNLVVRIDAARFGMTRDSLLKLLSAENVEAVGDRGLGVKRHEAAAAGVELPATHAWCDSIMQLPIGAQVDGNAVEVISERIRFAQKHAADIEAKLGA
jgi:dTDP-4-amino-4,6-dideoxygalactose transaminase